ncbi:hypothetical protein WA158_006221 [Blastocystis sp. Blastoise]
MSRDLEKEKEIDPNKYLEEGMVTFHGTNKNIHCSISIERLVMYPTSYLYKTWLQGDDAGSKEFYTGYDDNNLEFVIDHMKGKHIDIDMKSKAQIEELLQTFNNLDVTPPDYLLERIKKEPWNNGSKGIYQYLSSFQQQYNTYFPILKTLNETISNMNSTICNLEKDNNFLKREIQTLQEENQRIKKSLDSVSITTKEMKLETKKCNEDILIIKKSNNDIQKEVNSISLLNSTIKSEMKELKNTQESNYSEIKNQYNSFCSSQKKTQTTLESIKKTSTISLSGNNSIKYLNGFEKSTIFDISNIYVNSLINWLGKDKKWKLLFRASEHEYKASEFHKYCDNKGETVTIIKHIGHNRIINIFGGYTNQSWNSSNSEKDSSNEFLFTLKNEFNLPPTKYKHTGDGCGIACILKFGPIFGGGFDNNKNWQCSDISICDDCFNQSESWVGGFSYNHCETVQMKKLFTNTNNSYDLNPFKVDEYEIWGRS